ncbi:hypothetical protein GCM10010269_60510 [Streptomyces humidus]|uniref:Uncharacterized protein n=1 Tax=Streptomyces humidus TaxID=52259 RepID=A0A918G117_9ACTN|nr:hypothetical protein GCM10010269_60510 [Streptomyces humidus]
MGVDVQHRPVGSGDAERVEPEAELLDLLPHADLAQDAQGVALSGDSGAVDVPVGLGFDEVDVDAGFAEQDGQAVSCGAAADDEDGAGVGHGNFLVPLVRS